ncbi:hypothetical protein HPB51_013614 [Rhipicephalus microplus]|uniref:Uncharacterized protein n=1 Tax=Rhipicephalus microplus TaxID=6941 RepID=A0A9J6EGH0_RHIMP|nr:hypothetical protein HPB51_013614 [Rhipicephalus microplus]
MEDPSSSIATGSPRTRQGDRDGHGVLCGDVCDEEELCSKAAVDFLRASSGDPFQDGEDDAVYGRNGEFLLSKKPDEWARGDALANLVFELRAGDDDLFGGAERLLCARDLFEKEDATKDDTTTKNTEEPASEEPQAGTLFSGVSTVLHVANPAPSAPRRRFPCTLEGCDRVFERGRQLRVHLLSHTACRPFKCAVDGCDWAFATEYKLKRHMETHEGKKDFMCDVEGCGQHFTTVYNLRAHMKLHGRPTFGCLSPGCPQVFGTRRKMELHLREHQELAAPYRRHTEVCYGCGGLGHRADVCPNPNSKWCRTCGQKSPTEDHHCTPKCSLCGGPHPTADIACKDRFQVPYIVRRRRRQRHRRSEKTQMALEMQSRDSSVSPSVSGTPRRGRSVTPAAQRCKSRSRSRGRSASRRRIQEELTWADRVKEKTTKPKKVTRSALPEHDEKSEIERLRQEIASLKAELRKQTAAQAISSRVEGANVADNAVHKSTQEPKVEVNKAKRKAPPPKDESDSEMQVESSQNKMLEELLRISKENQLSMNQLALRMGALESKVGAVENKVVALENKMAIQTRPKVRTQAAVNDDAGATPQG